VKPPKARNEAKSQLTDPRKNLKRSSLNRGGQVDDALADIPRLAAEISLINARITVSRLDRANLAAAGRATITAYLNDEPDPLAYLRDELHAQGFGTLRGNA